MNRNNERMSCSQPNGVGQNPPQTNTAAGVPAVVAVGGQEGQVEPADKLASRSFCRLGGVFYVIQQMVTGGAQWEIARDMALRTMHPTMVTPGPVTEAEVNAIVSFL